LERGREDQTAAPKSNRERRHSENLRRVEFGARSFSPLAGAVVPECPVERKRPGRNQDRQPIEKLESQIRQKDEVLAWRR
jgi:hypothetical protein